MTERQFLRLGAVKDAKVFQNHLKDLNLNIPFDEMVHSKEMNQSPLAKPLNLNGFTIGNRFAINPMEGWDGTSDGKPSENTIRRWRHFGLSGAKLIWGGEAVAVSHEGRANPRQLLINENTYDSLAQLRATLIEEHKKTYGTTDDLLIGLQLTHSGRFSCPNVKTRPEPRILYRHPLLDRKHNLPNDYPVLTDGEIRQIIELFHTSARMAQDLGFHFVDIKHCHGYLGHEFLSAHTRDGDYGGSFENRTRFLREVVEGIRAVAPNLEIGVRLSAFDTIPYYPDPKLSTSGKKGPGIPEQFDDLLPYRWGFGVNPDNPTEPDLTEAVKFLSLLQELNIKLVNISAGSPYYNPHIIRPALYPPSDGYQPPEDPLIGVERQMVAVRKLKQQFSDLIIVGSAYTYLQQFFPNVAQAAIREGWTDSIGIGRMVLSYPSLLQDVLQGNNIQTKLICRTFSDCTTGPRNGLVSGCYPLDVYYKKSKEAEILKQIKASIG
jgi:NADPH2 dehydrogenase